MTPIRFIIFLLPYVSIITKSFSAKDESIVEQLPNALTNSPLLYLSNNIEKFTDRLYELN
jgi:hypothetical protein